MKRILIISSNRLGDSILSSGLNKFYKNLYKDSHLTFVCGETPNELFRFCKYVDEVIIIKKRRFALHWFLLWKKIFYKKWTHIIDLRGTLISFFLFGSFKKIFKNNKVEKLHKVEEVSKQIVGKLVNPSVNLVYKKKNKIFPKVYKKKIIVICPTANWLAKIWPQENYLQLIDRLSATPTFKKFLFVLVGPISEKGMINKIKRNNILNMYGKLSLPEIYFLLRECNLFIGNDSGLMHLAALAGVKTVGLFGPSNKIKYHPWGDKTLALSGNKSPEDLMNSKEFNHKDKKCLMYDLKINFVKKMILGFYKNG